MFSSHDIEKLGRREVVDEEGVVVTRSSVASDAAAPTTSGSIRSVSSVAADDATSSPSTSVGTSTAGGFHTKGDMKMKDVRTFACVLVFVLVVLLVSALEELQDGCVEKCPTTQSC